MLNIDLVTLIRRPAGEVWNSLTDPVKAELWMSGLDHAGWISPAPWGVGSKILKIQRFIGLRTQIVYAITAYERDRKLAYKTVSGSFSGFLSYEASIALVSLGSNTQLIYKGRGKLRSFFKLAEPLAALWAKRRFKKDFRRLKELVEAKPLATRGVKSRFDTSS